MGKTDIKEKEAENGPFQKITNNNSFVYLDTNGDTLLSKPIILQCTLVMLKIMSKRKV